MALFKPFLGDLRGKMAGMVFSANAFGAYIRQKVSPINPDTPLQTLVRERIAGLAKAWSADLTEDQRAGWSNLAKTNPGTNVFGNKTNLSGSMIFNSVNSKMLGAGQAMLMDAPDNLNVRPLAQAVIAANVAETRIVSIDFTPDIQLNEYLYLYAAVNVRPGITYVKNLYRFVGAKTAAPGTSEISFTLPANFPTLKDGSITHVMTHRLNVTNGGLTPGVAAFGAVTPAP